MRFTGWFLSLIAVITLAGCRPDMPETAFKTTIKVVDRDTGKAVPGALVLVGARISVEPEFEPPYDWAMAGNRAFTDAKGAARFKAVKGLHEGDKPNDPLWKALEARKPAVKRDILGVESGSILVLAPGYGLFHQPFGVTDNPRFNEYLSKRGETMDTFGGWFGRGYRAEDYNYPAVAVKAEELRGNREITVKVGKVASTGEEHRFVSFMPAIIGYADVTMSKDSGTTPEEKLDIYAFFLAQLEYAARVSDNPAYSEGLAELKKEETLKAFIAWKPDDAADHERYIHDLLTLKALERLTDEHSEVKEYAQAVLDGVKAEDDGFRYVRHFYNPAAPDKGLLRYDNALKWGAIGYPENPDNDWDWEDARAYYRAGDKQKAYKALGHVVHLLQDLGVPMHTRMITHITSPENRFETYFNDMAKNLGGLPPQYWQAEESVTTKGVKEKFEAVADLTFGAFTLDGRAVNFDDYYTQGGILKTPSDDTLDLMGRHLFPRTIAHTAGLMRAFHAQVNPAAYAQASKPDIPGGATDAGVKKSTGPAAKERVELVGSTMIGNAEVKFIDASGKVTKTIKSGLKSVKKQGDKWLVEAERIQGGHGALVLVNREKRFEDYDVAAHAEKCRNRAEYTEECAGGRETANPGEYWEKEVVLFNARGETITKKMFRTYPQGTLVATSHWENELSRDGSHYYVYYRDEQGGGNIEIYDVSGKMLAHGRAEREIENIEISSDGSLAAGYTYNQEDGTKRILLVGANAGKAKLVKAEGRINGKEWGASFMFFNPHPEVPKKKIWLSVGMRTDLPNSGAARWGGYLSFSEVPSDLSNLLEHGGQK